MPVTQTIRPLIKGDTRTLLDTATAQKVIDILNKLQNMEVRTTKTGGSRLDMSGTNAVLEISTDDLARVLGTAALLNISVSDTQPTNDQGQDGDIVFVYEP
jgi:hypothetical protein